MNPVYCAAVAPMDKNEKIDYAGFKANIDWYIGQGLSGITVNGGTGEFVSLTMPERKKMAETAVEHINSRISCMVCCAAETTRDAIEYARHAKSIGADSIMVIGPSYFKPSSEEIYQHFWNIAKAVDIPMVLYNNPGSTGTDLTPARIARICEADNIKYVKEASGDIRRIREIREISKGKIHVFCGSDDVIFESLVNGAEGWISITANLLPGQSQQIFKYTTEGDLDQARELFAKYAPLYTITEKPYKAIQTVKYCLDRLGLSGGASRKPRLPLTEEEKRQVDGILHQVGLLSPVG